MLAQQPAPKPALLPPSDMSDYSALLRDGEDEFRRKLGISSVITARAIPATDTTVVNATVVAAQEKQKENENEKGEQAERKASEKEESKEEQQAAGPAQPAAPGEKGYAPSFKFEELLERQLSLPSHYKALWVAFQSLDTTVHVNRQRQRSTRLSALEKVVRMGSSQLGFSEKVLRQLFFVAPDFYTHSWQRNCKRNPTEAGAGQDLLIDFPDWTLEELSTHARHSHRQALDAASRDVLSSRVVLSSEALRTRSAIFKQRLLALAYEHYEGGFLLALPRSQRPDFSPLAEQVWPRTFDLESVPDVPMAAIKARPKRESRSVQDFISEKQDEKDLIMEKAKQAARKKLASEGRAPRSRLIIEPEGQTHGDGDGDGDGDASFNLKQVKLELDEAEGEG